MNCPIRVDPLPDEGHNQNPSDMANEINTNNSLNGRRNSTHGRRASQIHLDDGSHDAIESNPRLVEEDNDAQRNNQSEPVVPKKRSFKLWGAMTGFGGDGGFKNAAMTIRRKVVKYGKFVGPGFMVSVAYIDPGMHCLCYA